MPDKNDQAELTPIQYYLKLGLLGQYPLFYKDWLEKVNTEQKNLQTRKSLKLLEKYFKKIDRHRTIDKKRIAISAMSDEEREEFLNTFFYALEEEILNSEHKYH